MASMKMFQIQFHTGFVPRNAATVKFAKYVGATPWGDGGLGHTDTPAVGGVQMNAARWKLAGAQEGSCRRCHAGAARGDGSGGPQRQWCGLEVLPVFLRVVAPLRASRLVFPPVVAL